MTIWLLALVLLASLAGLGYRQGAIRVAFSFAGILVAALLAPPLGHLLHRPLALLSRNPVIPWVLGPVLAFLLISMLVKAGAFAVHHKVDVYFKYNAGDLRLALWERLSRRLGLCLGLANGALYLLLLVWAIYAFSYWSVQLGSSDNEPRTVRMLNRLGRDLQASGLAKAAAAIDRLPPTYYAMADMAGVIYHNPLSEARLQHYPAFLGLAERPEFQEITSDSHLTELWMQQTPILELLNQAKIQAVLNNPELVKATWQAVADNLDDLRTFLETGKSPKYISEPILGRWDLNVSAALSFVLRSKPNITSSDMQRLKKVVGPAFVKTTLIATTDHQVFLKELPPLRSIGGVPTPGPGSQTLQGEWKKADGKYLLSLTNAGSTEEYAATAEGDRVTLKHPVMDLAFDRED